MYHCCMAFSGLWGPLLSSPLFSQTCWTCLNPPLIILKSNETIIHNNNNKNKLQQKLVNYAPAEMQIWVQLLLLLLLQHTESVTTTKIINRQPSASIAVATVRFIRRIFLNHTCVWYVYDILSYVWNAKRTLPFLDITKYSVKLSNVQEDQKPIITSENASYNGQAHPTCRKCKHHQHLSPLQIVW